RDELAENVVRPVHHDEMMTAWEAHEFLVRRLDRGEILLRELDGRRLIAGPMEKKEWDIEGDPQRGQVDRLQLIVKLTPREFRTLHQGRNLISRVVRGYPGRARLDEIGITFGQHVGPLAKDLQSFTTGKGWRADRAQGGQRLRVAGFFRSRQLPAIVHLLVTPLVDELRRPDIRREKVRPPLDHVHTEDGAPGMADDEYFRPAQSGGQIRGDLQGVFDHTLDGQPAASRLSILGERTACAALVPMHDSKVLFPWLPGLRDGYRGPARPAMQIEQDRRVRCAAHLNPLVDAADGYVHSHSRSTEVRCIRRWHG